MKEKHIIECFDDTLETGDGHILRESGQYAGNAKPEVIILDYSRYKDLVESKRLLYEETKYIPASIRRFINKIGRTLNYHSNWGEKPFTPVMPKRHEIEESAGVREKDSEGGN